MNAWTPIYFTLTVACRSGLRLETNNMTDGIAWRSNQHSRAIEGDTPRPLARRDLGERPATRLKHRAGRLEPEIQLCYWVHCGGQQGTLNSNAVDTVGSGVRTCDKLGATNLCCVPVAVRRQHSGEILNQ